MGIELERILFASDGSADATLAARAAVDVSDRSGAELHVVHAWRRLTHPAYGAANAPEDRSFGEEEAGRALEAATEEVRGVGGAIAGAHLREGILSDAVNDLAADLDADLVVVGSRGADAVDRLAAESVSEGVVHGASCPVLVVKGGNEAWPPRNVVVGDDASEVSADAGRFAAGLGRLFGAPVVLVQAFHYRQLTRSGRSRGPERSRQVLDAVAETMRKRAAFTDDLPGGGVDVEAEVGGPVSAIRRITEARGAGSLVAVGSRSLGAVGRLVLGSVSTDVLRAVDGPVLVAPARKGGPDG